MSSPTDRNDHAARLRVIAASAYFAPTVVGQLLNAAAAEIDRLRARVDAAEHNDREIRKHLACRIEAADRANAENTRLRARIAEMEADRMDIMNLIIQPWTREGDGARLFKINLAWWETAESREQAMMLVRDASAALKATVVPAGNLREPEQ